MSLSDSTPMYNPRIVGIQAPISHPLQAKSLSPCAGLFTSIPAGHVLIAILCDLLVITVYVWLISVGTWTHWPARWYAYDAMATSFRHGQLALEQKPTAALLALTNPYDPVARNGIQFPQDASLYNGRFYYYFGPVPALILVILKTFVHARLGDHILVFAFASGILLLQSLLLLVIGARFFARSPAWMLVPAILAAGLTNPLVWILSTPSVYNAAITAGQFFFLAGFIAVFSALASRNTSVAALALAGLLWAAAIGSRITQIIPIAFTAIFTIVTLMKQYHQAGATSKATPSILALLGALAASLACIAWYNWARFGSIFETGITYQLAGVPLQAYGARIYSSSYVVQNLYNYLLNPPIAKFVFPYLNPTQGAVHPVLPWIHLSLIYRAQEITGLLYTAPFAVLAAVPLASLLRRSSNIASADDNDRALRWLVIALAGSVLFSLAFFLTFFWAAERYLLDFLPGLIILSFIGAWQLDQLLQSRPTVRWLFWAVLLFVVLASITVSILLSMTFNSDGFRRLNPVLWRQLSNLFRR